MKYLLLGLLLVRIAGLGQTGSNDTIVTQAILVDGIYCSHSWLPDVEVKAVMPAAQKKYWAEWNRLRNAVYVTYPYAKAASKVMKAINLQLIGVQEKQQRRAIILSKEKDLKKEFTSKLTQLSIYQGKVLMKLINRETGNNCYEIIEAYKGKFTAGFWQTVAIIVGTNLKQPYNAQGDDRLIEAIVQELERMYGYKS